VRDPVPETSPALLSVIGAPGTFWWPTLVLAALFGLRYLVFAGFAFWMGYRAGEPRRRKLQAAMPSVAQIRREIGYSAIAVVVFGAISGLLAWLGALPHTLLYRDMGRHGIGWFVVSIVLALVLHDAWFYWAHRLLHVRRIFPFVHRIHHLSTNPTPWTAYAFHPLESVVQALGVVLIVFVVPMHPLAIVAFQTISTAVNVYGHSGYELYPCGWSRHPLGRWINTSVAHNAHHAAARYNYGLYFLWWDRWMGTLDPGYDRGFDAARAGADDARRVA
jgi:sterol desaturase/sphingolipid hydroxylase (fatty acid hydroxylase superfamily)